MSYSKERDEAADHYVLGVEWKGDNYGVRKGYYHDAYRAGADWEHKRCEDVLGRVVELVSESRNRLAWLDGNAPIGIRETINEALNLLEGIGGKE